MSGQNQPGGGTACANGPACRAYNPATKQPEPAAAGTRLGPACLADVEHHLRALLPAWLDLEQLQLPTLSQSLTGQPGWSSDPHMPVKGGPEALQQEIRWVLMVWETLVRERHRLARHPDGRVRPGLAVQRAVATLAVRVPQLAAIPATMIRPSGCEDAPQLVDGVDACQHIVRLHQRCKAMLGRTVRTFWVNGDCSHPTCGARKIPDVDGPLYRSEPKSERDEPQVYCAVCGNGRPYAHYEQYVRALVWPALHGDDTSADAA
jgi:hypothetical protein